MAGSVWYSQRDNTVYILSRLIEPSTVGKSPREITKIMDAVFRMSYPDRIEKYASEDAKKLIYAEIEKHPGCKISEFMMPNCSI